jgi:hypothetical protein
VRAKSAEKQFWPPNRACPSSRGRRWREGSFSCAFPISPLPLPPATAATARRLRFRPKSVFFPRRGYRSSRRWCSSPPDRTNQRHHPSAVSPPLIADRQGISPVDFF